jgi:hypothetical protein
MTLPDVLVTPVRQHVSTEAVADVATAVRAGLDELPIRERVSRGMRICVAVGSRGITGYADVVGAVIAAVREAGGEPFLVPAMGSHGAATAEGQRGVLERAGMGAFDAPIFSSLDTVQIGTTPGGTPVLWDTFAAAADGVIVVNRVKAHTAFRGAWESGLFKMIAVGLGKARGADVIHAHGIDTAMPAAARVAISARPVIAGVAIVENGCHAPARVEVIAGERIEAEEPRLLELARALQPHLPFESLDLLVVEQMGKDISGTGMDTNVIGMWRRNGGLRVPDIRCLAVLELTGGSHGNATGIGMADVVPQRLVDQVDWAATYTNCLAARNFAGARRPLTLPSDRDVFAIGCAGVEPAACRLALVRNTLALDLLWVSSALLEDVRRHPQLEVVGAPRAVRFDESGRLLPPTLP